MVLAKCSANSIAFVGSIVNPVGILLSPVVAVAINPLLVAATEAAAAAVVSTD